MVVVAAVAVCVGVGVGMDVDVGVGAVLATLAHKVKIINGLIKKRGCASHAEGYALIAAHTLCLLGELPALRTLGTFRRRNSKRLRAPWSRTGARYWIRQKQRNIFNCAEPFLCVECAESFEGPE